MPKKEIKQTKHIKQQCRKGGQVVINQDKADKQSKETKIEEDKNNA